METKGIEYKLKIDDSMFSLLNNYHGLTPSEVTSFFGSRALEMLECEPNITENSRKPVTVFDGKKTRSYVHRYRKGRTKTSHPTTYLHEMRVDGNKVYVLRGFFPDTHIPFKMTLVKFDGFSVASGKVMLGDKDHYTRVNGEDIERYSDAAAEAALLGVDVEEDKQIKYEFRKFKCMRPRGMELYHEKKD